MISFLGKLLIVFLFLFAYTKIGGSLPINMSSTVINKSDIYNQPLAVTGEGKVFVKPDIAMISVGIIDEGISIEAVRKNIDNKINNVTKVIKEAGVSENDIKTQNYSLTPKYDWANGKQNIIGYSGSSTLQIKIRDTNKVGKVIDNATNAGANSVYGPNFVVDDKTKFEAQARDLAIKNAREKATQLAKSLNLTLGKIVSFSENGQQTVYGQGERVGATDMALKTTSSVPEIQSGENEIVISVTLSFDTK